MSTPLSHLSHLLGGLHNRIDHIAQQDPLLNQLLDGPDNGETASDPHQARLAAERRASDGLGDGNPLRHDGDGTRGEGPRGDGTRNDGTRGDNGRGDGVRGDGSRNDGARGDIARGEGSRGSDGPRGDGPRNEGPRGEGPRGEGPPRWGHVDGQGQQQRPGQANNAPSQAHNTPTGAPTYQGGNSLLGSAASAASQLVANTLGAGAATVTQSLANTLGAPLGTAAASAAHLADRAAMMAQNALHNAASAPAGGLGATNTLPAATASLQPGTTSPFNPQATAPQTARADAMLAPQRADLPSQVRAEQAATIQRNATMPVSSPPPAAPAAAAVATQATISAVPLAAVPLAVPPSQSPPVDGRPSLTAAGDRGPGQARADLPTLPPGHTAEGTSPRRTVRDRDGLMPIKLTQLLAALGLGLDPKAGQQDADAEGQGSDGAVALQWLFWALAIVGYGCLAVALVVLLPGGEGFLDETRNPAGKYALIVGLPTSLGAWWLARRMARAQAG